MEEPIKCALPFIPQLLCHLKVRAKPTWQKNTDSDLFLWGGSVPHTGKNALCHLVDPVVPRLWWQHSDSTIHSKSKNLSLIDGAINPQVHRGPLCSCRHHVAILFCVNWKFLAHDLQREVFRVFTSSLERQLYVQWFLKWGAGSL